jgi:hypothetical protein
MTTFTLSLASTKPFTASLAPVQFWRQPFDLEIRDYNMDNENMGRQFMGPGYRSGPVRARAVESGKTIPAVFRVLPSQQTKLEPEHLQLWRRLNWEFADNILETLIDDHFAWTNGTADIPAFDQARVCGGALLRGAVADGYLMIDSILTSQPVPPASEVLGKSWLWYYATEVNPRGVVTFINRTAKDGTKKPVRVPLISRLPLYVPVAWLHRLPAGFVPPSALWMA